MQYCSKCVCHVVYQVMNPNPRGGWRLFVDPVGANGGLGVWATHDTVRFHINREDADVAVDFLPQDVAPFFEAIRSGQDGLVFGCVQDDRGISLGSIGVVFSGAGSRVPVMDFLMQFCGEEATGRVKPDALEAWVAGLHDALVYANDMSAAAWNDIDRSVMDAAIAASSLGISPLTPLRRLSDAMIYVERRQSA